MANAFYRNTSSSAKKKSDRERRSAVSASEEAPEIAEASVPARRSRASRQDNGSEDGGEGRSLLSWSVSLTPSALVTITVLSVVLLGFSFLSGVIVGRGTMPLPAALELEPLLAEEEEVKGEQASAESILSAEELRFMTSLKSADAAGVLSESEVAPVKQVPAKKAEPKKAEPKKPAEPQMDYVLRAATFRDASQAKALVDKLNKEGLSARSYQNKNKSGTWYYVQVSLRGGKSDLEAARAKLASKFRIRDAMLVSEKPVPVKQTAKKKR